MTLPDKYLVGLAVDLDDIHACRDCNLAVGAAVHLLAAHVIDVDVDVEAAANVDGTGSCVNAHVVALHPVNAG